MPIKLIDYNKTEIYKLIHKDDINNENIYIGSTTNFRTRKCSHRQRCTNEKSKKHHFKVYQNIRNNGGWTEWNMLLVEKFPCIDKRESLVRERFWIDHFKSKLNSDIPCRTQKEWGIDNKEKVDEYKKKHYIGNKEEITKYKKEWYNDHKKEISEKQKIKYEKIAEQMKEKIECECGCFVRKNGILRHKKNEKHKNLMLLKNINI